jgi:hypothetical protein
MPLNTNIPLALESVDTASPLAALTQQLAEQNKFKYQVQRDDKLFKYQEGRDAKADAMNDREMKLKEMGFASEQELRAVQIQNSRIDQQIKRGALREDEVNSLITGAGELSYFLEGGDVEGGLSYLQQRKSALSKYGVSTQDTDAAIQALSSGDPAKVESVKNTASTMKKIGIARGLIEAKTEYAGGGDTGRLVDRLISEGSAKDVNEAMQIIKGGAGAVGRLTATAELGDEAAAAETFGKKQGEAVFDLPRIRSTGAEAITAIDNAIASPGLKNITGWMSLVPVTPGGERARAEALLDQVQGRQFLIAYEQLKGGGAITQIEGTKGEQAIAALGKAQKQEDVVKALGDLRGVVVRAVQSKEQAATQTQEQIKSGSFNPAPAGGSQDGWSVEEIQ